MNIAITLPEPDRGWALFLDVDGTLIEIAETPDGVTPDARLPDILSEVARALGGAVALVSGRSIATLDRLLHPLRLPAAGLHGLERRSARGMVTRVETPHESLAAARALRDFAVKHEGMLVEDKGPTVALHYRMAPGFERTALAFAEKLAEDLGDRLLVQEGKMVVELRPKGEDKGTAIEAFMEESPFAGRVPVFAGDDVTDEAGFDAVNRLRGYSVRIGPTQPTAARYRIAGVSQLLAWLALLGLKPDPGLTDRRASAP